MVEPDQPGGAGHEPRDVLEIAPLEQPPSGSIPVPGSKSLTNRALVCAALAGGVSRLSGVLLADDTEAMIDALRSLGVKIEVDDVARSVAVVGLGGAPTVDGAVIDARQSGTTARFVAPLAALGPGSVLLDGAAQLHERPMGDLLDALVDLGGHVEAFGEPGRLPVRIEGGGLRGGDVRVAGDVSSQFLSGMLLAARRA